MKKSIYQQELYHEIFGSILDRSGMNPYLLRNCDGYESAIRQSSYMMANRGFDLIDGDLYTRELDRARMYVNQAVRYFNGWLFPFVRRQLLQLADTGSPQKDLYRDLAGAIQNLEDVMSQRDLSALIEDDPRHLFLLASSVKYPDLFSGYKGGTLSIRPAWQKMGCSILKMCHLIKAIEEDSQDINDYAKLGIFLESRGKSLTDLFSYNWENPELVPDDEPSQRAFVKISAFFHKMKESMTRDAERSCLVFNSGDGVKVDIVDVKARLKSPESMFTKLGKDIEGEAYNIRDILAITFLLRSREDSLSLFHALQKRGAILQENTVSPSITQTLFDNPEDMKEAVRLLMINLARSNGSGATPAEDEIMFHAKEFFNALSVNAYKNEHSSDGHRKFQCKINFSLPVHRDLETHSILVPGTPMYDARRSREISTQQHTLPVEIRISDLKSWEISEQKGDAHHDAYKFRQLIFLMNRIFEPVFHFPEDAIPNLRKDQTRLFQ